MADLAPYVAVVVLVLAALWAACYVYPATRTAALMLARPVSWLLIAAAVLLSMLTLGSRPRRGRAPVATPPDRPDHGAATRAAGYAARIEADRVDAAERAVTAAAVAEAMDTGTATPVVDRERELRARAGLPPLAD